MSTIRTINPKDVPTNLFHGYLLGAVAPRPIAFASTIDKESQVNLSPFSFFNAFGSNPPILIFSPARRVRDNTIKHTLENVYEVAEVVINMVNFNMVQQMSLASTEFDKGVNEFIKAGFTEVPSVMVKPPRVGESPAAFECKVKQVIQTGTEGGAGNLIICEIVLAHFKEEIFTEKGQIDPQRIDLVARMGGDWYCRASGEAIFEVPKPNLKKGIGIDQLPLAIRTSKVLTGNDLGILGNTEQLPGLTEIRSFAEIDPVKTILAVYRSDEAEKEIQLHLLAKTYIQEGKISEAWLILLQAL